jgi:hypothetical protein
MAKTRQEREADAREEQLEHIRDQISSGELVIRQMTDSERVHWDDHSTASRPRRNAALKRRDRST